MVIVIIAILVTMVSLSMRGDRAGEAIEEEGKRLVALINLMREEAVMRNRDLGLSLTQDGYLFVARQDPDPERPADTPAFLPLADDNLFRPRKLPAGTQLRFQTERTLPSPAKAERNDPVLLALSRDMLFPPGELRLSHPATERSFVIHITADGAHLEAMP